MKVQIMHIKSGELKENVYSANYEYKNTRGAFLWYK